MRFKPLAISSLIPFVLLSCLFPISSGAWASSGGGIRVLRSDQRGLVLELTTEVAQFTQSEVKGRRGTTLSPKGYGQLTEPGKPQLPTQGYLLGIPPKGEVKAKIVESEWTTTQVGYIPPAGDIALGDAPWEGVLEPEPDPEVYSRNAFYPSHLVEVSPVGFIRDQRAARLQVYPFRYNPATGELRTYTRLVVQVEFASPLLRAVPPSPTPSPFEDLLSHTLLNYGAARAWRQPPSQTPQPLYRSTPTSGQYKILIRQEGIYHITYAQLVEAGVNVSGIDPRTIKVTNRGREVPIYVRGEGDGSFDPTDYLEFYGEPNLYQGPEEDQFKDPYSDVNVYWLSWGGSRGSRLVEESGGIVETNPSLYRQPRSHEFTVHAETDNTYDRLRWATTTADHWFWGEIRANRLLSYNINLPKPDPNSTTPVRVRTMLHGKTYPAAYPDHHVLIYLNNALVADTTWDGQTICFSEPKTGIPSSYLQDGTNTLTLVCPGDTPAGEVDIVYLNWVEVQYPRLYQAQDDYIEFAIPQDWPGGLYQFVIGGFSRPEVEVYKKGVSKIVGFEVEYIEEEGYYQVTFQDSVLSSDVHYIALTPKRKLTPEDIELDESSELRSSTNGADYLIITHENFYDYLQDLVAFWTARGLTVQVVKTTDIYDEFNHGIFSPEAIRDFLRCAYHNWNPSPTYVLLVGDGTWDYKNRYGQGGNLVPVYPAYTYKWGRTSADHLYACVSGDDLLPDLFIGRLPVRTNTELEAIVEKIIDYSQNPQLGPWRREVLMLGGMGDTFRTQSESLIRDYIPLAYKPSRIYVHDPQDPYHGGTGTLLDELEDGVVLVNFTGHGGGGIWSDASLLTTSDVAQVYNPGKLPFIVSLTCFTAAFDEPHWNVLGEEFVKAEEKGAVAFFGATGLGWISNDYYLAQEIFPRIFQEQPRSVGQILAEAKIGYFSKYQGSIAESMMRQYTLLGDPALCLGLPKHQVEVELNAYRFLAGSPDTIIVSARSDSLSQGTARVEVVQRSTVLAHSDTLMGGAFSDTLSLTVQDTLGVVRVYAWDESGQKDGIGFASFDVDSFFFGNVRTVPRHPTYTDSVHLRVNVQGVNQIGSVTCHVNTLSLTIPMTPEDSLTYRTNQAIPPQPTHKEIEFYFSAIDAQNDTAASDTFSYRIGTVNLTLDADDISLTGTRSVSLAARVENRGEVSADSVEVQFFQGHPDSGGTQLGTAVLDSLPEHKTQAATLSWPSGLSPGQDYDIYVRVDPDSVFGETKLVHRKLWMGHYTVARNGGAGDTLWGNRLRFHIPAEAVTDTAVLQVSITDSLQIVDQPDLSFAQADTAGHPQDSTAFRLVWADSTTTPSLQEQMTITLSYDTASVADTLDLRIYRWHEGNHRWVVLDSIQVDTVQGRINGKTNHLGTFTILSNRDYTDPRVEITVEGQPFASGDYVPPNPRLAIVVHDENGVDTESLQVELSPPVEEGEMVVPDSTTNANIVSFSYNPELNPGEYRLTVTAADCNGRRVQRTVTLTIASKFDILSVGNYPNPFSDEAVETIDGVRARTIFTYELTQPAEELSLKVYTVSGRLVRSFEEYTSQIIYQNQGYHEIPWDGTDNRGEKIANGVYFWRIKAKGGGQTVQRTMKLAKIE